MRKIISVILAFTMVLELSACGNNTAGTQDTTANQETESTTAGSTEAAGMDAGASSASEEAGTDSAAASDSSEAGTVGQAADGSNILIAYFSFPMDEGVDSVTTASRAMYEDNSLGNTNYISHLIQKETGGDLFSIEVEEGHYPTDDFEALAEFARTEIENGDRPAMQTQIENLDDYDVIFVGYPIWWYDMPAVMYSFFDQYDFSGKTIIPFTTHGGSGLSGTPEIIAELEPDATVSDQTFTISRDDVTDAESDVAEWIASLDVIQQ